eukprot:PhM_4_TR6097/c0_g1_i1/m.22480
MNRFLLRLFLFLLVLSATTTIRPTTASETASPPTHYQLSVVIFPENETIALMTSSSVAAAAPATTFARVIVADVNVWAGMIPPSSSSDVVYIQTALLVSYQHSFTIKVECMSSVSSIWELCYSVVVTPAPTPSATTTTTSPPWATSTPIHSSLTDNNKNNSTSTPIPPIGIIDDLTSYKTNRTGDAENIVIGERPMWQWVAGVGLILGVVGVVGLRNAKRIIKREEQEQGEESV